jgi:lipopolysaccharide biosynthesis regulator YciM
MSNRKSAVNGNDRSAGFGYYVSGLNAVIDGEFEHAISLLTKAVELDSDICDAYLHLGKLFIRKDEIIRGQKILRDLLLRRDIDKSFRSKVERALITVYVKHKDFAPAQEMAEYRVLKYPKDSQMRLTLTAILERQHNYKLAQKHWQVYCNLSKSSPYHRLALYKVEIARHDTSLSSRSGLNMLQQALRLDDKCTPAYILMARYYRNENKRKKVLEAWDNLLERTPEKSPWIFGEMEQYLYEVNRYQELPGIYLALCRRKGNHQTAARLALARHYYKTGKEDEALNTVQEIKSKKIDKDMAVNELIRFSTEVDSKESSLKPIYSLLTSSLIMENFTCSRCGATSKAAEWHCPECGAWESYLP